MDTFYSIQLEWLQILQLTRSPLVDALFRFLNFFDTPTFFFLLIPAVWMGTKHKVGLRFFSIFMLSSIINYALKELFQTPRPLSLDPSVALLQVHGYGLPSGGAQTAILLSGLLWHYCKKWRPLAIIFFVALSLSRIYIGAHFFTDVLGGWVVGALLLILFIRGFPLIEKRISKTPAWVLLVCSQLIGIFVILRFPFLISIGSVILGVGWGTFFCHLQKLYLKMPSSKKETIIRVLIGVIGTFALHKLLILCIPKQEIVLKGGALFILGLWLSFGAAKLWMIGKRKKLC